MKRVLTAAEMREVDRLTTERYGIPGLVLMENAGTAVTKVISDSYGDPSRLRVLVISGRGNNGGDGAVVARQLWQRGARVDLFLLGEFENTKGDARANFEAIKRLSASEEVRTFDIVFEEITTVERWHHLYNSVQEYDVVVDAI